MGFLKNSSYFFISLFVLISSDSWAQVHGGFVSPQFGLIAVKDTISLGDDQNYDVNAFRPSLRVDFMSIENHISINLLSSFDANHYSFGAQFRAFDRQRIRGRKSSYLVYGAGIGFSSTPGYRLEEVSESVGYSDIGYTLFARWNWDAYTKWGLFVEAAYESPFLRHYEDRSVRLRGWSLHRVSVHVGIPIDFDDW